MRKYPWDTWRIVMLTGALLQLGVSIIRMNGASYNDVRLTAAAWIGYGLLAAGFLLAMRKRSELKKQGRKEETDKDEAITSPRPDPSER